MPPLPQNRSTLRRGRSWVIGALCMVMLPALAQGAPGLVSDLPSPALIGRTIHWRVETDGDGTYLHRFVVAQVGHGLRALRDFSLRDHFSFTPTAAGLYTIRVESRELNSGRRSVARRHYRIGAPAGPVSVTPTPHPLVVLYSVSGNARAARVLLRRCHGRGRRACQVVVHVRTDGSPHVGSTPPQPLQHLATTTVTVAGLRPRARHHLRHEIRDADGRSLFMSSERTWETGEPDFELPVGAVVAGSAAMPSPAVPLTLTAAIDPFFLTTPRAYATDADGQLVWYDASPEPAMLTRVLTGGTFLSVTSTEVREVDLIGNVVRESNWVVLNQELRRRGEAEVLGPHHEALRLPDGRTAILVTVLQNLAGVQSPDLITVIGDAVLVLNDRFQLEWVWNAFDHLDVRRPPALASDFCAPGAPLCSVVPPATRASDWLHSNALTYSPDDGNLLISVRNQDWIVKIDYSDGVGSGEVLWRLGEGGDFQLEASGPWPWFSHQHAPSWRGPGQLLVYDNGNTRCEIGGDCRSRGQLYEIDEATRQARLVLSIPLHEYSFALGNTQALPDGVLHFGSGWATHDSRDGGVSEEFGPGGELRYGYFAATRFYRSYRLVDLYTAPAP